MNTVQTNSDLEKTPELPNTLTRTQLTVGLIVLTLAPFALVVFMYKTMPDVRDPVLEVDVLVGPRAIENKQSRDTPDTRVLPCVTLTNPTEEPWNYLNLSINHQFHYTHPDTVPPGGEVVVPLAAFHTKGTAYFPPESQELKELTIYAQIASGARAIKELEGSELAFEEPKN
mgnify:CR=1 FL=1